MPVPKELMQFFSKLVDKSKKSEINWQATGQSDAYRVTFPDMAISISLEGTKLVRIQLLNDQGEPAAAIAVNDGDEEWLGAISLINSANRKVTKIDTTMRRALEELGKDGAIGEKS